MALRSFLPERIVRAMALHSRMGRGSVQAQRYERFPLVSLGTSSRLSVMTTSTVQGTEHGSSVLFLSFFPSGHCVVDDDEAVP